MQGQDQDLQVQQTFGSASALLLLNSHAHHGQHLASPHTPLLQCHNLSPPLWEPSEGCNSLRQSHWDAEQPHSAPQRDKSPVGPLAQAGDDAECWGSHSTMTRAMVCWALGPVQSLHRPHRGGSASSR